MPKLRSNRFTTRRLCIISLSLIFLLITTNILFRLQMVYADSPPQFLLKWGTLGSGNGQFDSPQAVAVDTSGNVYVADLNNHVQKFNSSGTYITQWGSAGSGNGEFNYPKKIAVDSTGNVYVSDRSNNRIQKFNSTGTYITQWGSIGAGNGDFNTPLGIAIDSSNNVYVVDGFNNRVQKFNSTGTYITQWGTTGVDNGEFDSPYGIAVDLNGNVYVTDVNNFRIQKFDSVGTYITKWGIEGTGNGEFQALTDITVDAVGNVYVPDANLSRVQKFNTSGTYLTQWGTVGDGNGELASPYGIAIDTSLNIYVADMNNNRIQKFGPDITAPSLSISSVSPDPVSDMPRLTGTATDVSGTVASVQFQIDSTTGTWSACLAILAPFDSVIEGFTCSVNTELSAGNHIFYIRATDSYGNTTAPGDEASDTFSIDSTSEILEVSLDFSPNGLSEPNSAGIAVLGKDTITSADVVEVAWDKPDDTSNIHEYVLHYREKGSSKWKTETAGADEDSIDFDPGEGNWEWYLEIVYTDGSTSETSTYKFEVDNTAPENQLISISGESVNQNSNLMLAYGSPLTINTSNPDGDTVINIWNWDKTIHYDTMVCGSGICDQGHKLINQLTIVIYAEDDAENRSEEREVKISPFGVTAYASNSSVSSEPSAAAPAIQGVSTKQTTTPPASVETSTYAKALADESAGKQEIAPGIVNGAVDVAPAQSPEPPKKQNFLQKIWNSIFH